MREAIEAFVQTIERNGRAKVIGTPVAVNLREVAEKTGLPLPEEIALRGIIDRQEVEEVLRPDEITLVRAKTVTERSGAGHSQALVGKKVVSFLTDRGPGGQLRAARLASGTPTVTPTYILGVINAFDITSLE